MEQNNPQTPQNPENTPNSAPPAPHRNLGGRPKATDEEHEKELEAIDQYAQSTTGGVDQFVRSPHGRETALSGIVPKDIDQSDQSGAKKGRKRGKTGGGIARSPNRDEYVRLIAGGWTSFALERYAAYRHGETISASTFRNYKAQKLKQDPDFLKSALGVTGKGGHKVSAGLDEARIDVLGIRNELAALQLQRLGVDVKTELDLGKLFSTTKGEIQLLSDLLDKIKVDQRDLGILPDVREEENKPVVKVDDLPGLGIPRHATLADALGVDGDTVDMTALSRQLGQIVPINRVREKEA